MSVKISEQMEVPAALPITEDEEETRSEFLLHEREEVAENNAADENAGEEFEDEDFEEIPNAPKRAKKKMLLAFTGFCFFIFFLFLVINWFFGIGVFAKTTTETVDRTAKTNSPGSEKSQTEEEKLKMALDLVAEKNPNPAASNALAESESLSSDPNSSVELPPAGINDLNETVVVPDSLSDNNRSQVNAKDATSVEKNKLPVENVSGIISDSSNVVKNSESEKNSPTSNEINPRGRSLFFGIERKKNAASDQNLKTDNKSFSSIDMANASPQTIPFGTFLPVRLLGAVFTLRSSGGLVRMELTRSVSGKGFAYPAGTILVGTLRGSERNRAFISIVGLIDPAAGGLVKLTGEVMGTDGASGVSGRRRKIKGNWSRILEGLRDAAAVGIGAIGGRRSSGGTVIISDSASDISGNLSSELSGIVAGGGSSSRNANEFVEVSAGTLCFVLITDLPREISKSDAKLEDSKSATGLSEEELADLFSEGSPEKIRAAIPRMSPPFRRLAEKFLEMEGK